MRQAYRGSSWRCITTVTVHPELQLTGPVWFSVPPRVPCWWHLVANCQCWTYLATQCIAVTWPAMTGSQFRTQLDAAWYSYMVTGIAINHSVGNLWNSSHWNRIAASGNGGNTQVFHTIGVCHLFVVHFEHFTWERISCVQFCCICLGNGYLSPAGLLQQPRLEPPARLYKCQDPLSFSPCYLSNLSLVLL